MTTERKSIDLEEAAHRGFHAWCDPCDLVTWCGGRQAAEDFVADHRKLHGHDEPASEYDD